MTDNPKLNDVHDPAFETTVLEMLEAGIRYKMLIKLQ
jgi:hypothetical protein